MQKVGHFLGTFSTYVYLKLYKVYHLKMFFKISYYLQNIQKYLVSKVEKYLCHKVKLFFLVKNLKIFRRSFQLQKKA